MEIITNVTVVPFLDLSVPGSPSAGATISWTSVAAGYYGALYYGQGNDPNNISYQPFNPNLQFSTPQNSFVMQLTSLDPSQSYGFYIQTIDQDGRTVLAESNPALLLTPATTQGAVLTHPDANPRNLDPTLTSYLSTILKLNGQPLPGGMVLFSIESNDDNYLSVPGQPPSRSLAVITDATGTAGVTLNPGTSRGIAEVLVSSSSASGGIYVHAHVKQ